MGKSLVGNTAFYALGEIIPRVVSFIMLPFFTRYLSPSDYGIISYTNSVLVFLGFLGTLSLNSYVLRFYYEAKSETEKRSIIGTAYMAIGLFNLLLVIICFIALPSIIDRFNIQIPWNPYFKLAILTNFFTSFSTIPLAIYRVRQEANRYIVLSVSRSLLIVASNILFVIVLGKGIYGWFISTLIVSVPFFFIYAGIINKYANFKLSFGRLKEGLKFSLPLVPGAISFYVLSLSDRIILERNESIAVLGIYNIAVTFTSALGIAIQSGYKALEPEVYNRYGKDGYYTFLRKTQKIYYIVVYLFAIILSFFALEVFEIMTAKPYWEGAKYVPILIIGVILNGQNSFYQCLLTAEKKTKLVGAVSVIGAIVSFTFNILFIPKWGAYAAATSYAISYIIMNLVLYFSANYPEKNLIVDVLPLLCIVVISVIVNQLFPETNLIAVIVKLFATLLMFFLLQIIFKTNLFKAFKNYLLTKRI